MMMEGVLNATDVRKDWGAFIDSVTRLKPAVVKRNRDYFAALSIDHLVLVLAPYRFHMEFEQEQDGSFSGSLNEIDIVGNADNLASLREELAKSLIEYANQYMDEFQLYFNAPNRQQHFPYIINVLIQSHLQGVIDLIDA